MNTIEMNELNEMREQLAILKKRLESQEIVNDKLIKETMSRKLSWLNHKALWMCIVCLIMVPIGYLNFQRIGHSQVFCIATAALFIISFFAIFISHYRIHKRDIYSGDLVAVYKEVARMKKIYSNWHYWSIPMVIIWFGWLEYEIYYNLAQEDMTAMIAISMSGLFGGIIGGIIGLRIHKRMLRTADEVLKQIEELQQR